jgi:hypothetical protein
MSKDTHRMNDRETTRGRSPRSLHDELSAPRPKRFRRRDQQRAAAGADEETLEAALAELVLLREENARLKADRHQPKGLGDILGRARSLPAVRSDAEDLADDAAQMLLEGRVLRESLLEVCTELERAMAGVKARLDALGATHEPAEAPPLRVAAKAAPVKASGSTPPPSARRAQPGKARHGRNGR